MTAYRQDVSILSVKGAVIDQITTIGPSFGLDVSRAELQDQVGAALFGTLLGKRADLDSDYCIDQALALTLACGVSIANGMLDTAKTFEIASGLLRNRMRASLKLRWTPTWKWCSSHSYR